MHSPSAPSSANDAERIPLAEIDLTPHHLFESGGVLRLFERLRREDPVHYCANSSVGPYWSLTKYTDIMSVDMNHTVFSSAYEHGGIVLDDKLSRPPVEGFSVPAFIAMDEPRHSEIRKAVQPIVSTESLKHLQTLSTERTRKVLDSLPVNEEFDWVERVSIELTSMMLATLFDTPLEDRRRLIRWSHVATTIEGMDSFVSHERRVAELMECLEYFTVIWNERINAPPKFDLISMLAHSPQTRSMTPIEYLGQLLVLIVGGNDTTRNTMSATVNAMNLFPDEFRKLKEQPSLLNNMVQEVIRWQTPIPHQRRTALRDFQIRDKTIRKGDKVAMWYYSGNRDEDVFPNGDEIRLDRPNIGRHLSFGFGIHRCLGLRIAELQLRTLWQQILERFQTIELVRPPKRTKTNLVNGYTEMIVRIKA